MKTYLGIMRIYRVVNKIYVAEEWFIHFPFESTYEDEDLDGNKFYKDCWKVFWDLPNVSYDKILKNNFSKPDAWNYIRLLSELRVNTDRLHFGKWSKTSTFFQSGRWIKYGD